VGRKEKKFRIKLGRLSTGLNGRLMWIETSVKRFVQGGTPFKVIVVQSEYRAYTADHLSTGLCYAILLYF
jgi:hypothetical protein